MRISTFLNALAVGTLLLSSFSSCGKDDDLEIPPFESEVPGDKPSEDEGSSSDYMELYPPDSLLSSKELDERP